MLLIAHTPIVRATPKVSVIIVPTKLVELPWQLTVRTRTKEPSVGRNATHAIRNSENK
tara:strand:+ start:672 stop:845 length:174 start_codon:yes stop_codon:yes gene_type:complete